MSPDRICLSPPHFSGHEQRHVQDAFDTNWIAQNGPPAPQIWGEAEGRSAPSVSPRIGGPGGRAAARPPLPLPLPPPRIGGPGGRRGAAAASTVKRSHICVIAMV
jgi:hypothetical protein